MVNAFIYFTSHGWGACISTTPKAMMERANCHASSSSACALLNALPLGHKCSYILALSLAKSFSDSSNTYGMETKTDKTKVRANSKNKAEIYMNKVQFEEVNSFKYLGVTHSKVTAPSW